jgi:hypothetical protein
MTKSKKLPIAVERDVMKVMNRRIDKIDSSQEYKELEGIEIDYIPEAKTVWELLKYSARELNQVCIVTGATKKGWIDSLSASLVKKLPQEHQYRICQLITIVVRHVRKYVGEDAPSDRYVRKELPTKYKVEYRVKNAELQAKDTLKSSGTSSANNSKSLVEKVPSPEEYTVKYTLDAIVPRSKYAMVVIAADKKTMTYRIPLIVNVKGKDVSVIIDHDQLSDRPKEKGK